MQWGLLGNLSFRQLFLSCARQWLGSERSECPGCPNALWWYGCPAVYVPRTIDPETFYVGGHPNGTGASLQIVAIVVWIQPTSTWTRMQSSNFLCLGSHATANTLLSSTVMWEQCYSWQITMLSSLICFWIQNKSFNFQSMGPYTELIKQIMAYFSKIKYAQLWRCFHGTQKTIIQFLDLITYNNICYRVCRFVNFSKRMLKILAKGINGLSNHPCW